jgi:hypothetical protein
MKVHFFTIISEDSSKSIKFYNVWLFFLISDMTGIPQAGFKKDLFNFWGSKKKPQKLCSHATSKMSGFS